MLSFVERVSKLLHLFLPAYLCRAFMHGALVNLPLGFPTQSKEKETLIAEVCAAMRQKYQNPGISGLGLGLLRQLTPFTNQ